MIFYINIIPVIFTILALIFTLLICFGIAVLNFRKKRIFRFIGYVLSILLISIFTFGELYIYNTLGFLFSITDGNYALSTYNLYVLKDSNFNNIDDLAKKQVGVNENLTNKNLKLIKNKIGKKYDIKYKKYQDLNNLLNAFVENEINAIILENSEVDIIKEDNKELYDKLKSVYEIEVKNDIKNLEDAVNINKEPFNVYVSGIDTYGKINSSSRSDVNMVLTVNPKTEKILITWIPRDYYVNINDSSYKDKLTHSGIYGIDSSIYAIENLLDIDINYYVKVNFTSLIEVVDLFDGVTVVNDESFYTIEGVYFKKGEIILNGEQALAFVRERKNLAEGDVGRGKNQIKVLEALMNKAMSPSIIKKYNSILNTLEGAFITNMNHSTMLGFIKKEISNPRNWKFESNILSGTDSYEYTYTYKNTSLYCMKPNIESVELAKNKIKKVLKH